jgi:hypothetical protein
MPTRDLSNKRIQLWLAAASGFATIDEGYVLDTELDAALMTAPAVRWDGLDFGMQESEQIDDRSLDDDATSTLRGFMQFGGAVPFFFPKATDSTSILREVFNLVKVQGTELVLVERIGFQDRRTVGTAGDNVNIYSVLTDGYTPDTEGDGGYAYLINMLPQGDVFPWSIVGESVPEQVAITGGLTASLAVGALALRGATYYDNDITPRATWASDDETIATVDNRGIIEGIAAGVANITATFPGGAVSTACVVTVA